MKALLLVLLLVIPLAGQPIHLLVHKHHPHAGCRGGSEGIQFAEQKERCPVCEYEFIIVTFQPEEGTECYIPVSDNDMVCFLSAASPAFSGCRISPRAPPVTG